MMPTWQTNDGAVQLYLGDALKLRDQLPKDAAIVSDPPYGIGYKSSHQNSINYGLIHGDDEGFDPTPWLSFSSTILWGGNNFADRLPIGGWIVWDKRCSEAADKMLGSPFELAWCARRTMFKIVRLLHGGAKNADAPNGDVANQARFHPTQKPVKLMQACIEFIPEKQVIVDPYMGSGSTGLACLKARRRFIGCEIDKDYFTAAVERFEKALSAPLFDEPRKQQRELITV